MPPVLSSTREENVGSELVDHSLLPSVRPRLRRQVAWTFTGNLGYATCQWAMLALLTKTVSVQEIGQFTLGLAIAAPVLMLSNFQLRSIQATDRSGDFTPLDFLVFRSVSSLVALTVIAGLALTIGYEAATTRVIAAVALYKCLESLSDGVYGYLQRAEKMRTIAVSMLFRGMTALLALTLVLAFLPDVTSAALTLAAVCLIVFACWDLRAFQELVRREEVNDAFGRALWRGAFWRISRIGLPLGVTSALLILSTNIPRYVLEQSWGERELGYYAALAYPVVAFTIVVGAFCQAATPRLAESFARNRRSDWALIRKLSLVPLACGLAGLFLTVLCGEQLLSLIYTPDYASHRDALSILICAGALWGIASVFGYATTAAGIHNLQVPVSMLVCASSILVSWLLIPRWGLTGAATSFGIVGALSAGAYWLALVQGGRSCN